MARTTCPSELPEAPTLQGYDHLEWWVGNARTFAGFLCSTFGFTAVLAVVFASLAWAALYAAGVARRRIRLSTDQPIKALFETIGACGNPPKDDSYTFAVYAIVLLVMAWILVPAAAWLVISKAR